ncbi:hypothetical protein TSAR_000418, partial [Trichomalopsis sarcophagae]
SEWTFLGSLGHPEPEKPRVPAFRKYLFFLPGTLNSLMGI